MLSHSYMLVKQFRVSFWRWSV